MINIKQTLQDNKIKNLINKREWIKLFKYLDDKKLSCSKISNLDTVIDKIIDDKKIKVFQYFEFKNYYLYSKTTEEQLEFFDKIAKKLTVEELNENFFSDMIFFYACFKENKINDDLEKRFKYQLNHIGNYDLNFDFISIDFHKYIMLLIDNDNKYYNYFGCFLKKDILNQFYTIENFDLTLSNNWNDIIVDFAIDDGDILKYIKLFIKSANVTKLIDVIDDVIDCDDIENYEFIKSFSKCNPASTTAKLLKNSNLPIEQQKAIIDNAPDNCSMENPLSWSNVRSI